MVDYDDTVMSYATGERPHRLRVDPQPRERHYEFISVDDHLVEPTTTLAGRLPARLADRAPRVERRKGIDYWIFEDHAAPLLTTDAHQSWDASQWCVAPVNFDEIRRGTWDIHARVKDMDIAGISASLNFPSTMFGFSGQRFARFADPDLGLASLRAYNDWMHEEWYSPYPTRIIPCQVTWLPDPALAAAEIRRNASRGFRAVAFTENPERLGLPSLYSGEWDPFFAACEETDTVINLHVGRRHRRWCPRRIPHRRCSGHCFRSMPCRPASTGSSRRSRCGSLASRSCCPKAASVGFRWCSSGSVISGISTSPTGSARSGPTRHSRPKNCCAATSGSPVSTIRSRCHSATRSVSIASCSNPTTHMPISTWPDSQERLQECVGSFSDAEIAKLTHENAAALYRFALDRQARDVGL